MMYWNDGSADWAGWAPQAGPSPAPEDLLADRFARGDIDEEDYLHRIEVLRRHRPGNP